MVHLQDDVVYSGSETTISWCLKHLRLTMGINTFSREGRAEFRSGMGEKISSQTQSNVAIL